MRVISKTLLGKNAVTYHPSSALIPNRYAFEKSRIQMNNGISKCTTLLDNNNNNARDNLSCPFEEIFTKRSIYRLTAISLNRRYALNASTLLTARHR
jgi:hypothetical protein